MDKITRIQFFLLLLSLCQIDVFCIDCNNTDFNLTVLNGLWVAESDGEDYNFSYKISICSALQPNGADEHTCHSGTAICMDFKNGTLLSAGNASVQSIVENKEQGDVWYFTAGDACPEDPKNNLTTSINFKCGPLIGSPKFLDYAACVSYFEWESHVFCKGQKPEKDVPCYLYDNHGNRYDLSPLAKSKDAYLVSSEMDTNVYINVCRDINAVTMANGCPKGVGACKITHGVATPLGSPTGRLQRDSDGNLILKYTSSPDSKPAGCTSPPSTTIKFICPKRGGSKDPRIEMDFDCQYVIEWETEYACPESTLSNSSCVLTKVDADIDIDLRPLAKPLGENYLVNYTDSSGIQYRFYINICEELNIPCPDIDHQSFVGACQTKVSDPDFGQIMGRSDKKQLRYADNRLTLTYKGGSKCNHNNFKRMTEIEFICPQDRDKNTIGQPEFKHEDDCRYYFEWKTKYACLDHPVNEECRVNDGGRRYDLSSLVRTHDGNWVGLHDVNNEFGNGEYYINICHNILQEQGASGCDPGAAICYRDGYSTRNLGRYEQNPVYDNVSKTIQIHYTNGDTCGDNKRISSTIYFMCRPGALQSAPVLSYVSYDKCFYDFEWHTAAACVLGQYSGTDCKVEDAVAGFKFDLSPLTKLAGSYYNVSDSESHDYLINVCGPVSGTKCDSLQGVTGTGICQVPSGGADGTAYSAGNWSTQVTYFDGMINLTYTDGTKYNDDAHTPRKSEIAFLCDPDAGIGTPKYLDEIASDHYYGFEWKTAYACPTQPMECTVTDVKTGQEYDLSKLSIGSDTGNWMTADVGDKRRFYFNVCRPLNRVIVKGGCLTTASACTTKTFDNGTEVVEVADYGHIKSGLVVEGVGRLKLIYEGQTCNSTSNYTTTIHFICQSGLISSTYNGMQDGPCAYSIIWHTSAACPLTELAPTESCTIKDSVTDYVYNLQPLKKPEGQAYSVKVGNLEYKLNICGKLATSICGDANQNASVCEVRNATKRKLAEDKYLLQFNGDGRMAMTYEGIRLIGGDRVQVQIDFECQRDKEIGEPEFVRHEGDTYIFRFLTALACRPMEMDCLAQDEDGNQYNLGLLTRATAWTALDIRDRNTKYYINVCKPVNNVTGCPDEPIGGCQYASNGKWFSMGYLQSKPIARSDGSVTLTYRNGDVCHKGTNKESHRSTRINFYCSQVESGPVFDAETDLCEYIFSWRTPAACKLQTSEGKNCLVDEPLYHYVFDLSFLKKSNGDYHVHAGDFDYIINVCGPLQEQNGSCDLSTGVGACQIKPGDGSFTPVITGKGNSLLEYSAGELTLTYKDGANGCQTLIKFYCDYSKDGKQGPVFIEKTASCQYIFEWATTYACTPFKIGSCYVSDPQGNSYDLSSLTLNDDNYEVTENNNGNAQKYIINVCRSLVHKANATCPYSAGACMNNISKPQTDPSKYTNLGEVNSKQVRFENGSVQLVYTNGEPCQGGHMETHIKFICDKNAKETSPINHFLMGQCIHVFEWTSAAACPLHVGKPDTGSGDHGGELTCKTTNPITGKVYDLSSLKVVGGSNSWTVNDTSGHMYEFNVCGPLKGSKCTNASDHIGVCQSKIQGPKRTFNAGNSVNNIYLNEVGDISLNYTGGDRCYNNQYQRSTIITFVCNPSNGLGKPVYLDELEDCTYYISWHTNLVCEHEVRCLVVTDDFHTIDLSPLSRQPDHIVHSSENGMLFYLSVCSALAPVPGVLCPPGAGACSVTPGTGKMHNSLGRPTSAPTYDRDTGKVSLVYSNGSQCDFDPTQKFTTKIVFSCLPGPVRGSPVLISKAGCQYVFEWSTEVVCYDKEPEKPTDECGYHDYQTGTYFNFTTLSRTEDYKVTDNSNNNYYINPCKAVSKSGCSSGMVCRESGSNLVSFGAPKQYSFEREDEDTIQMAYATGGTCPGGGTARSEILFKCNREVGLGQPKYFIGFQCNIQFIWETSLVCPHVEQPCTLVSNGHLFDLSLLSKDNGAWNLSDSKGNSYFINICSNLNTKNLRLACGKDAGACRKSSFGYEMIGSVRAQKTLYKDNKTGNIVLEYENGAGSACKHDRRRMDSDPAKTRINFICGNTYGGPVFNESATNKEACLFEFTWKTKIACEIERQEVTPKHGTIFDVHSGNMINLQPLLNKTFQFIEHSENGDDFTYEILLDGTSDQCVDGVVCLKQKEKNRRVLGTYSSRKFYIDDDDLEAVYTTNEKCSKTSSKMNVTSVIQFNCNIKVNGTGKPMLISRSNDCVYIFSWDTPMACMSAQVIQPAVIPSNVAGGGDGSGSSSSKRRTSSKTVATVIGVFLVAISICILVVVFHKQERRAACIGVVRRLMSRKSSEYTQLPTAATDDFPVEEEIDEVVTVTDPAKPETSGREEEPFVHVSPNTYHDDSDEDMLL